MRNNRISALQVILKARHHELDLLAAELREIRAHQLSIEQTIVALTSRRDQEAFAPSIEAAPYVAGFLSAVEAQMAHLADEMASLEKVAEVQEEIMREKYADMMTWSASLKKLKAVQRYNEQRNEIQSFDAIGINMFLRANN
jgi:flagellar biosynthesis chaperone FliJ